MSPVAMFVAFSTTFCAVGAAGGLVDYLEQRQQLVELESGKFLGSDLHLTAPEKLANEVIMAEKWRELDSAFGSADFWPSQSFFAAKSKIDLHSDVFKHLRNMPKGGVLHVHEFAITSFDWLLNNVTYRPNLFMCEDRGTSSIRFGWLVSDSHADNTCAWAEVSELRRSLGAQHVDDVIRRHLSIVVDDPAIEYPNVNVVWARFSNVFRALAGLLTYAPVTKDYMYQGFKEMMEDNVQYIEYRTTLPPLTRDLSSARWRVPSTGPVETAEILKEASDAFLDVYGDRVCGIKLIYAPSRAVTPQGVEAYLDTARTLRTELPDLVIGFDLVGQEDLGRPLIDFVRQFVDRPADDLKFYFHAGETNWQGQPTDLNLVDAILLNTTRIGHGYALAKHPEALKLIKERNIPIELCPISNQVLGLVTDLRNHPVTQLIQDSYDVVVGPDDPGIWGAKGVSYDFYEVFMAMASRSMDLRLLKKLALNGLAYASPLNSAELTDKCSAMFTEQWAEFVENVISDHVRIIHSVG